MTRKTRLAVFLLLVTVGLISTILIFRDGEQTTKPAVLLLLGGTQTNVEGKKVLSFNIVNKGRSPIMCPDGWYLEFEDGSFTNLSMPQSGNVRVDSGETNTVSVAEPSTVTRWRLGGSYYEEDIVFDVKVRVDQSALKNQLPSSFSRVKGKTVISDWLR